VNSSLRAELRPTASLENVAGVLCRRWSGRVFDQGPDGLPVDFFVHRIGSSDPDAHQVLEKAFQEMRVPSDFDPRLESVLGEIRDVATSLRGASRALLVHSMAEAAAASGPADDRDGLVTLAAVAVLLLERSAGR
jgi:hypothetical protein